MHSAMNFIIIILINFFPFMLTSGTFISLEKNKSFLLQKYSPVYGMFMYKKKLYIPKFHENEVSIFQENGKHFKTIEGLHSPHSIVVNDDYIIVGSYKRNTLYFINQNNNYNIESTFTFPKTVGITSLGIINDTLFVADYKNGSIFKFDYRKQKITKKYSNELSQFHDMKIFVNKIYILDRPNKFIIVADTDLNILEKIHLKINLKDFDPLSLYLFENTFFITDYSDSSLKLFLNSGEFVSKIKFKTKIEDVFPTNTLIDEENRLYLCFQGFDRVIRYNILKSNN